ncbi:MAG: ACT domain-containing protein [Planctomycetes bacterium]|nr:ACT domain-containing protein [Planctomycetota bacterium]
MDLVLKQGRVLSKVNQTGKGLAMHLDTQFSIFMINKPGVLARILNELANAKINIVAMTMMDSMEHGVMRLVGTAKERIREVLNKLNLQYSETDVLCLNLPNKAGAFADVTEKLAKAHINIAYAYCTAGARGGRTTAVVKVADVKKAMKVLQEHTDIPNTKTNNAVRRSPVRRK